jgi:hypothetical protein
MRQGLAALGLAVLLAGATTVAAASPGDEPPLEDQTAPSPNSGALALSANLETLSAYYFRGYNKEDTGYILQPSATLYVKSYESDQLTLTPFAGLWSDLQDRNPGATNTNTKNIYETDYYGGADLGIDAWTITAIYTLYTFPGGVPRNIQEVGLRLAYDDTQFTRGKGVPFALRPYVGFYVETSNENGPQHRYAEVGIGPSFKSANFPVTWTLPVVIGLSPDGYYTDANGNNEAFGHGSVGLTGSLPLGAPSRYGAWVLTAGIFYDSLWANSTRTANDGGETYEVIGRIGIGFTY